MDFRNIESRASDDRALAGVNPFSGEPVWTRVPVLLAVLILLAIFASVLVPSPEVVVGQAVVQVPGVTHVRVERSGIVAAVDVVDGDYVRAGQVLTRLSAPELEEQLRILRAERDDAIIAMLRNPRDDITRREVGRVRAELAKHERKQVNLVVRSPADGVVLARRVRLGSRVTEGDIVFTVANEGGRPEVVASFVGPAATRVEDGALIRLYFEGAERDPVYFVVDSVAREAIRPDELYARPELATDDVPASVVVVRGVLERKPISIDLVDGMTARAELLVRARTLAEHAVEILGGVGP